MRSRYLLVIILSMFLAAGVHGASESEPNDSLDDPQIISEGKYNGTVNGTDNNDIFRVDVQGNVVVFFSLKKTDTGSGTITRKLYDSSKEPMEHYSYYYDDDDLDVAGQVIGGHLLNTNSPDNFFIVVSGSGSYELNVIKEMIDDPTDVGYSNGTMRVLNVGDEAQGKVFTFSHFNEVYEDKDRYSVPVSGDVTVKAKITRLDQGQKFMNVTLGETYDHEEAQLLGYGDSVTLERYVDSWDFVDSIELTIWGEGEYKVEISSDEFYMDDAILFSMMGGMICISFIFTFLPIIIIVIIIVVVVKKTTKKDRTSSNRAPPRTGDQPQGYDKQGSTPQPRTLGSPEQEPPPQNRIDPYADRKPPSYR